MFNLLKMAGQKICQKVCQHSCCKKEIALREYLSSIDDFPLESFSSSDEYAKLSFEGELITMNEIHSQIESMITRDNLSTDLRELMDSFSDEDLLRFSMSATAVEHYISSIEMLFIRINYIKHSD